MVYMVKEGSLKRDKLFLLVCGEKAKNCWSQGKVVSSVEIFVPQIYKGVFLYSLASSWLYAVHGSCNGSPQVLICDQRFKEL